MERRGKLRQEATTEAETTQDMTKAKKKEDKTKQYKTQREERKLYTIHYAQAQQYKMKQDGMKQDKTKPTILRLDMTRHGNTS